ncbi:hypothetical protein AAVH_38560, partial [Aphelenchoides avenae]
MPKRQHDPQAPASASEDLVKRRLKAAANDAELLREIIGSNDVGSVATALVSVLSGGSASAPSGSALRKK